MQYVGGKQKSGGQHIAKAVSHYVQRVGAGGVVEPFCGGLSVTYRLACKHGLCVSASDACRPLITLYRAMQEGWVPPAVVDRATWERLRERQDPDDPMTAFAGFGCSRSGAWFSSYVFDYKYTNRRVPAATAARDSLRKKLAACRGKVLFDAHDYADAPVHGVWYCDIPYQDTLGYPAVGAFNYARFWDFATRASESVPVLVSERVAPAPFVVLQEWSVQRRLNTPTETRRMERLFVHERWIKYAQH